MRQDQRISDLAALGIHEHRDLNSALRMAASLELWISGYSAMDYHDKSHDYEDTLDIHACESFGYSKLGYGFRTRIRGYAEAGSQMCRVIQLRILH